MEFQHPFYFLRHGETTWNKARKTQGQLETELTDLGREQAAAAGLALKNEPIERIVASPLGRVRATAQAVARHHDVPLIYDDGLKECHLGDMQGQPHGDWLADYWRAQFDPPNGEPFPVFADRVWQAMAEAVARGPNTLIVAHGGLWMAAQEYIAAQPELRFMPNCLPLHVTPKGKTWHHRVIDSAT